MQPSVEPLPDPVRGADATIRDATSADVPALQALILAHGPNPWNHLPVDEIRAHVAAIAEGRVDAVVAEAGGAIIAAVTYETTDAFRRYRPSASPASALGHVCEAVVHREHAGRSLGSRLLRAAVGHLRRLGCDDIYVERHEQNAASAAMMARAGFVAIDTFDDPLRRPNGSGRTTVCRFRSAP
ncbi:GNAT family N-acetyltransferase [Luteimonas suaedae]|uniref:GNAT family N-acetyltransferase n=1 Tax=Luteimonas suaedae TaxID=2605430 RepID=UPI0011EDAE86|nr:GNAT family N-acetyltransferase [Luteimonas suaedae]